MKGMKGLKETIGVSMVIGGIWYFILLVEEYGLNSGYITIEQYEALFSSFYVVVTLGALIYSVVVGFSKSVQKRCGYLLLFMSLLYLYYTFSLYLFSGFGTYLDLMYYTLILDISPDRTRIIVLLLSVFLSIGSILFLIMKGEEIDRNEEEHIRGRSLISYEKAHKLSKKAHREGEKSIFWGFLKMPLSVSTSHFAIIGSTGSGKTISIRLLMQSVLPEIGKGRDTRALIYDAKQDMLSILSGIVPDTKIHILNPFDKRCVAWDMSTDITSPVSAQQVASILIPENKNASQPFFSDAARHLLTGVMISLIKRKPGGWTFKDIILSLKTRNGLIETLSKTEETAHLTEQYFSDRTTSQNVMSTIATKMQRYEFIAAAWDRAEESMSLRDWLSQDSILLLGNDEAARTALDAINQVIFKRLSELILSQTESDSRRTWIFLDELRQAGRLNGLSALLTKGRSKGASIVLGYQDIEGLRDVYGNQLANEIAGQCAHKAILRCDSVETAKWGASLFGEREILEKRESQNDSTSETTALFQLNGNRTKGQSASISEQIVKREVVLPSQIMGLPQSTPQHGLSGFYVTPIVGAYFTTISGTWIGEELKKRDHNNPDIIPRNESDQYLSTVIERHMEAHDQDESDTGCLSHDKHPIFSLHRRVKDL